MERFEVTYEVTLDQMLDLLTAPLAGLTPKAVRKIEKGDGRYAVETDLLDLLPPKEGLSDKRHRGLVRNTRAGKIALSAMADGRPVSIRVIGQSLELHGYSAHTAAPVCSHLCGQGDIVRVGHGVYQLSGNASAFGEGAKKQEETSNANA